MRSPQQLIQAALGDPEHVNAVELPALESGPLKVFQVRLTGGRYRGLPPLWHFAVVHPTAGDRAWFASAQALFARATSEKKTPLVVLSDDPDVRVAAVCRAEEHREVYGLDAQDLPSARKGAMPLRAPFIMAVRAKLSQSQIAAKYFQPYHPGHPVEGWRFFGRRAELQELVDSPGNQFVVGARMTGKTSLLKEAARVLEEERGARVYTVPLQYIYSIEKMVAEIVKALSEREAITAARRAKLLDESLLASVLKRLAKSSQPIVLILDEFGNVLKHASRDGNDWTTIGMLREYSQNGGIRLIMSGYQELFLKQASDFEGPFVNFARVIRLSGFRDAEIEDFLVQPLQFWGNMSRSELLSLAVTKVGRHPLLLQYFAKALFDRAVRRDNVDLNVLATELLNSEGIRIFENPVDEIFARTGSYGERFLFLKRCREAEKNREPLADVEITDSWAKQALDKVGCESTYDGRRLLLESLELRALTVSVAGNRSRQRIAAPIVYSFLKYSEPELDAYIAVMGEETKHDRERLLTGRPDIASP